MRQLIRRLPKWTVALLGLGLLSGCNFSLGPVTKNELVFIKHKGIAARVAKSVKVPVIVEKDGKTFTQTLDIGGFYLVSPDEVPEPKP